MSRYRRKVDIAQGDIVDALERVGCKVVDLSWEVEASQICT